MQSDRRGLAERWAADHRDPVNRALHFWIGMPLVGCGLFLLLLLDARGFWAILAGYAFMFAGHFLFERNLPSILRSPKALVGAGAYVIERLVLVPGRRLSAFARGAGAAAVRSKLR